MGAEVLVEYIYQGWCNDCNEGTEPGDCGEANRWMEAHNDEHHQDAE